MSWSSDFIRQLQKADSLAFRFRLHFLPSPHGAGSEYIIDNSSQYIQIEGSSIRINGTSIQPQSFSATFGQFSIVIVGDYRYVNDKIAKGQLAVLYAGFEGYAPSDYQRLIWGNLEAVRKINFETFELVFGDALMSLNTRQDKRVDPSLILGGRNVSRSAFFYTIGQSTTLTANFNTNSGTNIYLTDITIFEKSSLENGLIAIEDEDFNGGQGGIIFAEWSSKTTTTAPAGYLTLVNTVPLQPAYPSPSTSTFSTEVHAAHAVVYNAAQISEFPPHIIYRLLELGGSPALPASWRVGGDLGVDIYDYSDADAQKDYIKSNLGGTYSWRLAFDAPETELLRVISSKASSHGQWAVLRQGRISWRGCADIYYNAQPNKFKPLTAIITDTDIQSVISHEFYDPAVNAVYHQARITIDPDENTAATLPEDATTLPIYNEINERGDGVTLNPSLSRSNLAGGDLNRMRSWLLYPPEKLTLNCKIGLATLVAGDDIILKSDIIYGLDEEFGKTINRRGMISAVDIDFSTRSAIITILFLPKRLR
jgi:hypothetical protein